MLINSALNGAVSKLDLQILDFVTLLLNRVVDVCVEVKIPESAHPHLHCHSISRAISQNVKHVQCVDGYMLGLQPNESGQLLLVRALHSWLVTNDNTIIDPYPVGYVTPCPVLAGKGKYAAFGCVMYQSNKDVTKKILTPKMLRETWYLSRVIKTVMS